MKKLRALFVIPGPSDGASMIFAKREAAAVAALGPAVECFFLRSRTSPAKVLSEWRRARVVIQEFEPDLIHAHFGTVTGLFAVFLGGAPVVITFRGSDLNPDPTVSRIRDAMGKLFSQLALLKARRVICVSEKLRKRLWWKVERAEVLTNGVDLTLFAPGDQLSARTALGFRPDDRIVLFNAGLSPAIKRLDLARDAVIRATRRVPAAKLVVLDGTQKHEDIPKFLNAADCLLITSDFEGSPTIVKEALACNLPIVSVDVGDVEERVRGVEPSYIVQRSADSLADALASCLSAPRRSNGRTSISAFSEPEIAGKLIEIYERVLESERAGDSRRAAASVT